MERNSECGCMYVQSSWRCRGTLVAEGWWVSPTWRPWGHDHTLDTYTSSNQPTAAGRWVGQYTHTHTLPTTVCGIRLLLSLLRLAPLNDKTKGCRSSHYAEDYYHFASLPPANHELLPSQSCKQDRDRKRMPLPIG